MKRIILLFVLISSYSCSKIDDFVSDNKSFEVLTFSLKDKELNRFFLGSDFYGLKGVQYKDSAIGYSLKRFKSLIKLELENKFIDGFREGILLEDSIHFYLHDLNIVRSSRVRINFNKYKKKEFHFLPLFNRENLEVLKNRSSQLFILTEDFKLKSIYSSEEYKYRNSLLLSEVTFHPSTAKNFENLKSINLHPESLDSFIFIHNPLTGLFTCLPLLENFSSNPSSVIEELESKIQYKAELYTEVKDVVNFSGFNVVSEDIIISNKIVRIKAGSKFLFKNDAKMVFDGSQVEIHGIESQNIEFTSEGNNSILFSNSNINISHSYFAGFSRYHDDLISLPSAITFYNSTVFIEDSTFKQNITGDDLINFYNSSFEFYNSSISESLSDAIDSDFSTGKVKNVKFFNIGNDALDFSGSKVEIINCHFDKIADKAVSAGESSIVDLSNSSIRESELAIVVKDGSKLVSKNNSLVENRVNYAVFFKKDFYDVPILIVDELNMIANNLFQFGVEIYPENIYELQYLEDVESLLYGSVYGKSSK